MSFRSPLLLLLAVALVPAVWAAFAYAARRRSQALALFLGDGDQEAALAPIRRRRAVRAGLLVAALGLAAVALAGPRAGTALRETRQESLDLLVALDVSASMRAEDVAPSRLERAKLEVERIVAERRGDRVGLVVFAGEAFLQSPLTTDAGAFRLFLDAADPEQIAVQGTDFARALAVADAAFDAASDDAQGRPRALLVVSDGEDHEGGLEDAADDLRADGVEILALGIGTDAGAEIPDIRRGRVRGMKRDRTGAPVVSTYQEGALLDLAGRDGVFRVERQSAAGAVNRALDAMDRAVVAEDEVTAEAERFQWPLGLALLLLIAERALALRRRPGLPKTAVAAGLALVVLGGCSNPLDAIAPGVAAGRAGVEALEAGDVYTAEAHFVQGLAEPEADRATRARLWHGLGLARLGQDRASGADSAFVQALAVADGPAQRARYAFDAGTAALAARDPARADSLLQVALRLAPADSAVRRNQEIARRRLEGPPVPEPTPFAERVKARADSLVGLRQYPAALDVMREGLAQDSSVAAYGEFMQRLGGVVEIEEAP